MVLGSNFVRGIEPVESLQKYGKYVKMYKVKK